MEWSHETKLHIREDLRDIKPVKSTYSKNDNKDNYTHDNYSFSSLPLIDWICEKSEKCSGQGLTNHVQISSFKFLNYDGSKTPTYEGTNANDLSSQVSADLIFPWNRLVHDSDHPVGKNVEHINTCVL